jgi:phosphinothricin acetyltransferase
MTVSSDSVTIRLATDADLDAVAAIRAHHVLRDRASFETEPPNSAEMRRRRNDVIGKGLPYFVAVQASIEHAGAGQAGEVLGYACAYRPGAAYAHTAENSAYRRPAVFWRGIGRRLLSTLVAACEQCGPRQMSAVVGDSGNEASIRLHEKLGFWGVGVLRDVGCKHGVWLDSVPLQRSLGAGSGAPLGDGAPCRADG